MALRYQKPPLVEALCEVRFASTEERRWDWTIPGMLYERIRDRFPTRKERHAINIPLATPVPLGAAAPSIERLQFVSVDENTVVQVGPDLLAVNSMRPHLGWAELRDTLLDVLATYREIASPSGIAMTAVRYINRVEIPDQSDFALEKYFKVLPGLPAGVPRVATTFLIHTRSSTRLQRRSSASCSGRPHPRSKSPRSCSTTSTSRRNRPHRRSTASAAGSTPDTIGSSEHSMEHLPR